MFFLLISVLVETVIEMTEDNFVFVQALAQTGNPKPIPLETLN